MASTLYANIKPPPVPPPLSGGGGARRHVVDRPGAAALPADGQAAGADGVRHAGDLLRRAEEGGAIQRGGRAALLGAVVLADSGGVLQRGASPLHALRLRTLEAAGQHGRHLSEVSDHEGGPGEWIRICVLHVEMKLNQTLGV